MNNATVEKSRSLKQNKLSSEAERPVKLSSRPGTVKLEKPCSNGSASYDGEEFNRKLLSV
jgi:hypothetical protein